MPHTFEYVSRPDTTRGREKEIERETISFRLFQRNEKKAAGQRESAVKSFKPRPIPPAMPPPCRSRHTPPDQLAIPFFFYFLERKREGRRWKEKENSKKRETVIT